MTQPAGVVQNQPNYQLIKYQADNIPLFDGNPKQLNRFINACDNFYDAHKDANADAPINTCLFDTILNKLVGRAADQIASRIELTSWALVKNAIIATFADQRSIDCVIQDIITSKPDRNESPQQFGLRLQDIRSLLFSKVNMSNDTRNIKLLKIAEYNNLILKTFINGLNYHMQLVVRLKKPDSLEEAMAFTLEEENFIYYKIISNLTTKTSVNNNLQNMPNNKNTPNSHYAANARPSYSQQNYTPQFYSNFTPRMPMPTNQNFNNQNRFLGFGQFRPTPPNFNNNFANRHNNNYNFGQRTQFNPRPQFNQNNTQRPFSTMSRQKPEPMEVSSVNTILKQSQSKPKPNWVSEELFNQSVEPINENNDRDLTNQNISDPPQNYYYSDYDTLEEQNYDPSYTCESEYNPYENEPEIDHENFQQFSISNNGT
jgi:hypothetical protein